MATLQVSSEIQVVLAQITQLQSELQNLSSRVGELEASVAEQAGGGFGSRAPGQDYIGGDGGEMLGTPDSGSVPVQGNLRFKAGPNTNIVVKTTETSDDSYDGEIEIGVYYK